MLELESKRLDKSFSKPILDKSVYFFKKIELMELFGKYMYKLSPLEKWLLDFDDESAHFVDNSHIYRFFLLINALIDREQKDNTSKIKKIEWLNDFHFSNFENEVVKLEDKSDLWDYFLDNNSIEYFKQVMINLTRCHEERTEDLNETIRETKLDPQKVSEVREAIVEAAKINSYGRLFVTVDTKTNGNGYQYFGINKLIDKIYLLPENIDAMTSYDFHSIGDSIGTTIGLGESEYIFQKIYDGLDVKTNKVRFETFIVQHIDDTKNKLLKRGFTPDSLIISTDLIKDVYKSGEFSAHNRESENGIMKFGKINSLDVQTDKALPEGIAIMFDKTKIGTLYVSPLNPEITTSFDKDKIIKQEIDTNKIQDHEKEKRFKELEEKVNIKAIEKIKFEFGNEKAGILMSFQKLKEQ